MPICVSQFTNDRHVAWCAILAAVERLSECAGEDWGGFATIERGNRGGYAARLIVGSKPFEQRTGAFEQRTRRCPIACMLVQRRPSDQCLRQIVSCTGAFENIDRDFDVSVGRPGTLGGKTLSL